MTKLRYCAELYKHGRHFDTKTVHVVESYLNFVRLQYSNYLLSKPVEGCKYSTPYKDITKLLQCLYYKLTGFVVLLSSVVGRRSDKLNYGLRSYIIAILIVKMTTFRGVLNDNI